MTVQHGGIAMHAKLVCGFMNFQPAGSIHFIGTDLFSYLGSEDLCAAAG
jgi:hypothetical protein